MGKAKRRNEQLRDIKLDENNRAVYTGDLFRIDGDGRKARVRLGAGLVLLAAAVIASGCIDAAGTTNTFYVILPYIGEVSALFALCWNAVKVVFNAEGIRKYVYDSVSGNIPGASRVLAVFAMFGFIASCIYLIVNGFGGKSVKSIIYLALKIASAVAAELYGRDFRRIKWEKVSQQR